MSRLTEQQSIRDYDSISSHHRSGRLRRPTSWNRNSPKFSSRRSAPFPPTNKKAGLFAKKERRNFPPCTDRKSVSGIGSAARRNQRHCKQIPDQRRKHSFVARAQLQITALEPWEGSGSGSRCHTAQTNSTSLMYLTAGADVDLNEFAKTAAGGFTSLLCCIR